MSRVLEYHRQRKNVADDKVLAKYLNSNKIKRDTDWKCKFNLKSGIKKTVDFYKEYYDKS